MAAFFPWAIPSPSVAVWHLGPIPIRAYAVAILLGIFVALYITHRRYQAKGGPQEVVLDVGMWAVVCGILGARIYYVLSTPDSYFGADGNWLDIFKIWEGGLAIMGGLIGGAFGVWCALKRRGLRVGPFVDALAPGLLIAQAIGRFGNYFNQELFGTPTNMPWGLEIDAAHMPAGYPEGTLFHPTFLYEQIWNLLAALLLIVLEKKLRLRGGQVMAGYFMLYAFGRFWIEMIRTDYAHSFGGLRFNSWAALIVFLIGLIAFMVLRRAVRAHPRLLEVYVRNEREEHAQID